MGANKTVCEEDSQSLENIINPIDVNQSDDDKIKEINDLTGRSLPVLESLILKIGQETGVACEQSVKSNNTILKKTQRGEIKTKKPWFGVEHIRDTLRFRSRITELSQILDIFDTLTSEGVSFVKIDLEKLNY